MVYWLWRRNGHTTSRYTNYQKEKAIPPLVYWLLRINGHSTSRYTDYQEEMAIPPLVYWLPRRNVHSTFGLFTTKKKWPFPLLFTDSKKKWPFHLWNTDYQEEMAISPLVYRLPRRNVNSTFVLLNMVIPPFIYWLQEEMVYLWFIDCQEEMWIPHPDIRNGNSTSKHVQLYQTISIMYKLFYSIRKLTLLFSIQFSCVSFNACNSFRRCLFYILYNDMIVLTIRWLF